MAGSSYEAVAGWEKLPEGYKHLDVPGIAVDSRDRVYLVTRGDSRVLVFERDGTFVTSWGEDLFGPRTHGITVGPDDSVYCADEGNHVVYKFSPDGRLLMTIGTPGVPANTGSSRDGSSLYARLTAIKRGAPPFNQPTDVAVAPNGEIYVTDGYGNARVHRFAPDGTLIQSWGEPGNGPGEFNLPHGICFDADGRLLVADRENDRVQLFSPTGEFLGQWTDVHGASDVCVDGEGLIYVGEMRRHPGQHSFVHGPVEKELPGRISVFDPSGRVVDRYVSKYDGVAPYDIWSVHALCVDSRGDLYAGQNGSTAATYGLSPEAFWPIHKLSRKTQ